MIGSMVSDDAEVTAHRQVTKLSSPNRASNTKFLHL